MCPFTSTSRNRLLSWRRRNAARRAHGFTLVEVMVVVAIIAILAGIAGPAFTSFIANQRTKSTASDLYIALAKARSEAIKLNTNVTITPKTSGNWKDGWTTTYLDGANLITVEDHGPISGANITGPSIVYGSAGRISGSTAPLLNISVTNASVYRCLTADISGRPYLKKTSC